MAALSAGEACKTLDIFFRKKAPVFAVQRSRKTEKNVIFLMDYDPILPGMTQSISSNGWISNKILHGNGTLLETNSMQKSAAKDAML